MDWKVQITALLMASKYKTHIYILKNKTNIMRKSDQAKEVQDTDWILFLSNP